VVYENTCVDPKTDRWKITKILAVRPTYIEAELFVWALNEDPGMLDVGSYLGSSSDFYLEDELDYFIPKLSPADVENLPKCVVESYLEILRCKYGSGECTD